MIKDRLVVMQGDITVLDVDAIVNAANTSLADGSGVNGAIHEAAGPALSEACEKLGGCTTGHAKVTPGFNLPAKFIIHAVGPVWRGGSKGEAKLLASAYYDSLKLASEQGIKTIAFPAISCGIYGYPISQAAMIAVTETARFLGMHPDIEQVIFVCFDDTIYQAYTHAIDSLHHD